MATIAASVVRATTLAAPVATPSALLVTPPTTSAHQATPTTLAPRAAPAVVLVAAVTLMAALAMTTLAALAAATTLVARVVRTLVPLAALVVVWAAVTTTVTLTTLAHRVALMSSALRANVPAPTLSPPRLVEVWATTLRRMAGTITMTAMVAPVPTTQAAVVVTARLASSSRRLAVC